MYARLLINLNPANCQYINISGAGWNSQGIVYSRVMSDVSDFCHSVISLDFGISFKLVRFHTAHQANGHKKYCESLRSTGFRDMGATLRGLVQASPTGRSRAGGQ